ELSESALRAAFKLKQKQARSEAIDATWKRVFAAAGVGAEGGPEANAVKDICFAVESKIVRNQILDGEARIDGRETRTARPRSSRTPCAWSRRSPSPTDPPRWPRSAAAASCLWTLGSQ